MVHDPDLDVVTVGRAAVDLYGLQFGGRLEDMGSFNKYLGGCAANIAVGAARLGLRSGILTRVGDDHMGRFLREQFLREGVNTDGIVIDPNRLTGLVILGISDSETFPLIFYRENCADMALSPEDIAEPMVRRSRALLITGTHLSQSVARAACQKAIAVANEAGRKIIFDIDYRPVLWGLTGKDMGEARFIADAEVTRYLQKVAPDCDLIVGTKEEIHILGGSTDTLDALRRIRGLTPAIIVCKMGAMGCAAFDADIPGRLEDGIRGSSFDVNILNVLGAGDGFMSGFLRGWLKDEPLDRCCTYGNAAGALVVSRHGCSEAIPGWEELAYFMVNGSTGRAICTDTKMRQLHWAINRSPRTFESLLVLAADHRTQFEELAERCGAGVDRIGKFKMLTFEAIDAVARGRRGFGLLMDDRFGRRTLERMANSPYWIGRPIELPGSVPLEFESSACVSTTLEKWPLTHVVKCLVRYSPEDPKELRDTQDQQLLRLFDACRNTRHELLIEIIVPNSFDAWTDFLADVLERMYILGVNPDWWKLQPTSDSNHWSAVSEIIEKHDQQCRGILLLGMSAPVEDLMASFRVAKKHRLVKGFAVGRSIFADAAQGWFNGELSDENAVELITENFAALVHGWESICSSA